MDRLLLVRHAATGDTRRAAFSATTGRVRDPACATLDAAGAAQARGLAGVLPPADRCWSTLAARAWSTAELAGYAPQPDRDLAECDFGAWAGRTPQQVHATDPDGLAAWYADPDAAPHGGEGLADVRRRAVRVLTRAAELGGTAVAFTHGGLVKAALLTVLDLPATAVWRLDADPASVTELSVASGRWRVTRLNWVPTLRGVRQPVGAAP